MGFYEEKLYPMTVRVAQAEAELPHLKELVAGTLPLEKFKFQAKQNYNYLLEYTKALAVGLAKCQDYQTIVLYLGFIREVVEYEVKFYREHWKEKLGLSLEELDGTIMSSVKRSYTSHEQARSWEGDLAEQFTALLPCSFCYWELGKTLFKKCTLPKGNNYRDWIEFYTTGWYNDSCLQQIDLLNGMVKNKTTRELARIEEIYAIGCNYEYMSWSMYYNMETWPFPDIFPKKFRLIQE